MDERKWIERILAGDTQSFSCLVAKYEKMAYTIALRILENREEAEEAVQDAFVKMYRALSDFHFDSKFSTWFYRIVYRTALTALRQQRMFVSYEEAGPVDLSNDEVESATALLEREDRKEMIARTLKKLPADEALLLTLYYLEECSVEEICQITELSASNVKVKLFRIMALIIQEKKRVYKYYIKKRFTPVGIFSIFVAYMLVLVGILYLVKLSPGGAETVLGSLRAYFPIVLTIASGISCFFLFTQLDNWLKREEIRRQNTSK